MEMSSEVYAALWDGRLAAVFGLARGPFLHFRSFPWLLGTEELNRHPRAFVLQARTILEDWAGRYGPLEQAVDARYEAALRWAGRVGFHKV